MIVSRRRLLKIFGGAGASAALIGGFSLSTRANGYYAGPVTDHFDGTHFYNLPHRPPRGLASFARLFVTETWQPWPARVDTPVAARPAVGVGSEQIKLTFVGHASWLVQTAGLNILVDPVWSDRASPMAVAGPRRVTAPGIAFDDLPPIHVVLVTHNHYDHMDMATLERLWLRDRPRAITPLGNDTILRDRIRAFDVTAVDWHETAPITETVRVHAVPALHWSGRGLRDRRHALWASYILDAPGGRVLVVGDSGFGDGSLYRDIGARHPALDLAILPIGAYEPRWFMKDQHMNPQEAVEAFLKLGAKAALGHHWGTFQLTAEARERPPRDLDAALRQHEIPADRFRVLQPGQVHEVRN